MPNSQEIFHDHTNDEALRGFDFSKIQQNIADTAIDDVLFNSHGENRDGASIVPATE